ncbi:peptide chain release factor 1, partial [Candidatus Pelagibacter sp.]|nr:peptide chain release factor 1 [Candidatus Pelagibacter sp.]
MIPTRTIEDLIMKHSLLEKELSSGDVDKKLFAEKSKEYSDLNEVIDDIKKYSSYENEKQDLEKILDDSTSDDDFKKMAQAELEVLKSENEIIEKKLKLFLLPKDEADKKNAIIEIRAGTGGLEASLFASDLFKMYEKVSHKKKWELELISMSQSEAGGLKEVIASIRGKNIYSTLKYESGVHRVQRVPDTETQGRVHTSAATVAVLPEAEEVDVKINDSDLRIDVFRAGGPGGQSVNTTDSAVRITHIPSGLSVSQQDEKSQHKNKAKGMKILRSRLYDLERSRIDQERSQDRKSKIGTGDRSERIRTYNFPQGRVTDHRINLTLHKLEEFLEGEAFDEMIETLTLHALSITFFIFEKPSNPPLKANFGSKLITSLSKYFKFNNSIYGGFETIISYLPILNLSTL